MFTAMRLPQPYGVQTYRPFNITCASNLDFEIIYLIIFLWKESKREIVTLPRTRISHFLAKSMSLTINVYFRNETSCNLCRVTWASLGFVYFQWLWTSDMELLHLLPSNVRISKSSFSLESEILIRRLGTVNLSTHSLIRLLVMIQQSMSIE